MGGSPIAGPPPTLLYAITAVAAFVTGLIPLIAAPILAKSLDAFTALSLGGFYGSLVGTLILFAVPVTLLGCVSPFAIRLALDSVSGAGNTSGSLYALSTVGSIVGTFVPTFLLIPRIGTFRTFYLFALTLLIASVIGLLRTPATRRRTQLLGVAVGAPRRDGRDRRVRAARLRPPRRGQSRDHLAGRVRLQLHPGRREPRYRRLRTLSQRGARDPLALLPQPIARSRSAMARGITSPSRPSSSANQQPDAIKTAA